MGPRRFALNRFAAIYLAGWVIEKAMDVGVMRGRELGEQMAAAGDRLADAYLHEPASRCVAPDRNAGDLDARCQIERWYPATDVGRANGVCGAAPCSMATGCAFERSHPTRPDDG